MAKQIQAVRGMNDCLPGDTQIWQKVEDILRETVSSFGYQEIRFPIVESTDLFKRSIGEVTDIVEKEMYTFADRNGDNLRFALKVLRYVFVLVIKTVYCITKNNVYGIWVQCSVTSARKKAVTVNSTNLA